MLFDTILKKFPQQKHVCMNWNSTLIWFYKHVETCSKMLNDKIWYNSTNMLKLVQYDEMPLFWVNCRQSGTLQKLFLGPLSTSERSKKCASYPSVNSFFRKIRIIFDVENWVWKSEFCIFDNFYSSDHKT